MIRGVIVFILVVAAALGALFWSQQRDGEFFVSGFIEAHDVRIGSRVGGRVLSVDVHEGQHVAAGTSLVRLDPYDWQQRLAEAQAELAARKAKLDLALAGFRREEIDQARAVVERQQAYLDKLVAGPRQLEHQILEDRKAIAEAELAQLQRDYNRIRGLFESNASSRDEYDRAATALLAGQARAAAARDELALSLEGTRAEDIADARARLAEAQAALALKVAGLRPEEIAEAKAACEAASQRVASIQTQMDELVLRAPCDCVVEAVDLRPGDLIGANVPVVSLIESGPMWVRAFVPEKRLNLAIGQRAWVRVDALPQRRFAGTIAFVSREAEFTPANIQTPEDRSKQVFRIKVMLDEGGDVLRAGMSADVFFDPPDSSRSASRPAQP